MFRRHVQARARLYQRNLRRFLFHNLLHTDDPPHKLALGAAIAMFIMFTPTIGFQMVLAVFFSWLFRANKTVGIAIVWISNPATIVPIFYSTYLIGRVILNSPDVADAEWWRQLSAPPPGWWPLVEFYWSKLVQIAAPLWVGGAIVGCVTGYATYYVSYHSIRTWRLRRWGQLMPPKNSNSSMPTWDPHPSRIYQPEDNSDKDDAA